MAQMIDKGAIPALEVRSVNVYYGEKLALRDVNFPVYKNQITALVGPSGCGKSTMLRCFNRLNDLIPGFRLEGEVLYCGQSIYDSKVDAIEVRRRIGMVFQKPNPFEKSIFENVAFAARVCRYRGNLSELVEKALHKAALWDEVKDRLKSSALSLSGGQQQRLCIARAIALQPEIILMDEPCSALDPISTQKIEELMTELRTNFSIVIVTHNMHQALRVADNTGFFSVTDNNNGEKTGHLVEFGLTRQLFENPANEETERYLSGQIG